MSTRRLNLRAEKTMHRFFRDPVAEFRAVGNSSTTRSWKSCPSLGRIQDWGCRLSCLLTPRPVPSPSEQCRGRNCSNCPSSNPQLLTEPFMCGLGGESRMPSHEIRKSFDFERRFDDAYASHRSGDPGQPARHTEDQIGFSDGKYRWYEERKNQRDTPPRAKPRHRAS